MRDEWLLGKLKLCTYMFSNSSSNQLINLLYCAGDSGYTLRRWLLTPFPNPQSAEEINYNDAHACARSVVQRAIGLLKCTGASQ